MRKRTILLYGRSRAGKTQLIAEFAQHLKMTTGLKTLLYYIDKGGLGPIMPLIELGIVDLVEQLDTDPWIFMNKASTGQMRDEKGKWVKADLTKYALVANESMTGFSDAFMNSLAQKAADGVNIGGAASTSFSVSGDETTMKIGGNNMGHYNVVQNRILDEVWRSQKINVPNILWTASASRDDDTNSSAKVIGPAIAGKALTAEMLRQFDLTFRVDCSPSGNGKPEKHTIFLGNSLDIAAGNAVSLGNTRTPMAPGVKELPPSIEPASLVKALELIDTAGKEALEAIRKQVGSK